MNFHWFLDFCGVVSELESRARRLQLHESDRASFGSFRQVSGASGKFRASFKSFGQVWGKFREEEEEDEEGEAQEVAVQYSLEDLFLLHL